MDQQWIRWTAILFAGFGGALIVPAAHGQTPRADAQAPVFRTIAMGGESFLGVNLQEINAQRAHDLKLKEEAGVEVTRVESDSPAERAGLKAGDVILEYNGEQVEGMEQFSRLVHETPPGRHVKLVISRDGVTQTLIAKIGQRRGPLVAGFPHVEMAPMPAIPDLPSTLMMWRNPMLGVEAEELRGQLADYFGVQSGVLVRSVVRGTPADKAGLKAGDVILKVDGRKVMTPGDVTSAVISSRNKKAIPIVLMRDHKELTLTASVDEDNTGFRYFGSPYHDFRAPAYLAVHPVRM
jgi:serine protease Do